ncbi:MAG: TetR/AcrR family transcriptional regulator [Candidatus Omnitrophica bacterium]|nr:TetR/AcrR family transcriptional regulator [Candidatus Omnitrophota bacterium]
MISRKERDKQLRRSDILKAAEHLFALKGYHKATIRDIAKEAQYASGTVYLHFKDKNDLYFALLEEKMKSMLFTTKERVAQANDVKKKLEIFVQEGLSFFEKNQDFFRIFISEEDGYFSERKILKSSTGLQTQEYTAGLLREAQKKGLISKDFDAEQIAEVFTSIIKTIILNWLQKKDVRNNNLIDLSGTILRLFLKGVADK